MLNLVVQIWTVIEFPGPQNKTFNRIPWIRITGNRTEGSLQSWLELYDVAGYYRPSCFYHLQLLSIRSTSYLITLLSMGTGFAWRLSIVCPWFWFFSFSWPTLSFAFYHLGEVGFRIISRVFPDSINFLVLPGLLCLASSHISFGTFICNRCVQICTNRVYVHCTSMYVKVIDVSAY